MTLHAEVGTLGGFKNHGEIIKKQYGNYYVNYLKELGSAGVSSVVT